MDPTKSPQNAKVLAHLCGAWPGEPVFAWHREYVGKRNPYMDAGCHPDIVERIWDQIGAALPSDCRCLVYGWPALMHPVSGAILALAMGTTYALRLTGPGLSAAFASGAKTVVKGADGSTDIRAEYGPDWVFGSWATAEPDWCQQAFDAFGS